MRQRHKKQLWASPSGGAIPAERRPSLSRGRRRDRGKPYRRLSRGTEGHSHPRWRNRGSSRVHHLRSGAHGPSSRLRYPGRMGNVSAVGDRPVLLPADAQPAGQDGPGPGPGQHRPELHHDHIPHGRPQRDRRRPAGLPVGEIQGVRRYPYHQPQPGGNRRGRAGNYRWRWPRCGGGGRWIPGHLQHDFSIGPPVRHHNRIWDLFGPVGACGVSLADGQAAPDDPHHWSAQRRPHRPHPGTGGPAGAGMVRARQFDHPPYGIFRCPDRL